MWPEWEERREEAEEKERGRMATGLMTVNGCLSSSCSFGGGEITKARANNRLFSLSFPPPSPSHRAAHHRLAQNQWEKQAHMCLPVNNNCGCIAEFLHCLLFNFTCFSRSPRGQIKSHSSQLADWVTTASTVVDRCTPRAVVIDSHSVSLSLSLSCEVKS